MPSSEFKPDKVPSARYGYDDELNPRKHPSANQPNPKDQLAIDALVKDMQLNAVRLAQIYRIEMMNPVVSYDRGYWNITFSAYKSRKAPEPIETVSIPVKPNVPAVKAKPVKQEEPKEKKQEAKGEPKQFGKPLKLGGKPVAKLGGKPLLKKKKKFLRL